MKNKALSKAYETEKSSWWKIITESGDIDEELKATESKTKAVGKAKADISNLVTYLKKEKTLEEQRLSPLVKQAYDELCILETRRFL